MTDIAELGLEIRSDGVVVASKRLTDLEKKSKRAETATERLKKKVESFNKVAGQLAKVAAVAALGIATLSVRAFAKFDQAMTGSLAIMGDVSDAMRNKMSQSARKLALEVTFSASEVADSYFFLASAGLNAEQSIAALPQVARFAQAGMFDMATATDLATDAQSALGLVSSGAAQNLENLTRVTDVLVSANTLANATVQQFSEALTNKAGTAMRDLNIEIESGIAVLAAWADQGVKGAEAGERFNIVTRDLQTAVRKNAEEFERFNIAVFEGGEIRNMSDIILDLENALGPMSTEMRNATLATLGFQDRSVIAIKSLIGMSTKIKEYEVNLRNAGGITQEVADKQLRSFENQMKLLGSAVNDAAISLGERLAPSVLALVTELKNAEDGASPIEETGEILIEIFGRLAQAVLIVAFGFKEMTIRMSQSAAMLAQLAELIPDPKDLMRFGGAFAIGKDMTEMPEKARAALSAIVAIMEAADEDSAASADSILGSFDIIGDGLRKLREGLKGAGEEIAEIDISELPQKLNDLGLAAGRTNEELEAMLAALMANAGGTVAAAIQNDEFALSLDQLAASLGGPVAVAQQAYIEKVAEAEAKEKAAKISKEALARALKLYEKELQAVKDEQEALNDETGEFEDSIKDLLNTIEGMNVDPFADMVTQLEGAREVFADQPEMVARIDSAIISLSDHMADMTEEGISFGDALMRAADATGFGLSAIQSMTKEGSKGFKQLEVAIQATNVVAAVGAVLNQGNGDPYTAFARMAAMAASVASLGFSVGGLSAGFTDTAAERQASQGTGTVLGDADAKSESILRAVEITADASKELIGLNRGMLRALQTLQAGISGATGIAARGADNVDFDHSAVSTSTGLSNVLDFLFDPNGIFGSIFGGKSKITDEGIAIFSGTISEIIEQGLIVGFQEVQFKKWVFGSTQTDEAFSDLSDAASDQFSLVLLSIADAVREGALALGLSAEEIDAAINAFTIEEQRISLMDLSAEEQQAELQAVFSSIFDGLAGSVVPFIGQFQRVGEGLGETLVRVATEVMVVEEAIKRLGFQAEQVDPEQFAQLSDALIAAAGGLDAFISGMNSFISHFASDAVQFDIAQRSVTEAFDSVGLAIPATRDGMWELMQSLDASTEAGREQIAMLLNITDSADAYYGLLEDRENERAGLLRQILVLEGDTDALRALELDSLHEGNRELQIRIWALEDEAEAAATIAQHRADVTDFMLDLGDQLAELVFSSEQLEFRRINQEFEEMTRRAIELGLGEETLGRIRDLQILKLRQLAAQLEDSLSSLTEQLFGGTDSTTEAFGSVANQAKKATTAVNGLANSIRQTIIRIQGTQGLSTLSPTGQRDFLQQQFDTAMGAGDFAAANQIAGTLAASIRATGSSGEEADRMIEALLADLAEAEALAKSTPPPTGAQVGSIGRAVEKIVVNEGEQIRLASDILDQLGILAQITGESPFDIADRLGIPLGEVVGLLLDLEHFGVEQVSQLGVLAMTLGVGIAELGTQLGLDIGTLTDSGSLLSQGLRDAIMDLPNDISKPLLFALDEAVRTGDVDGLEDLVDDLPAGIRDRLAPFFDGISLTDFGAEQLAVQGDIEQWTQATASATRETNRILNRYFFNTKPMINTTKPITDPPADTKPPSPDKPKTKTDKSKRDDTTTAIENMKDELAALLRSQDKQLKKRNEILQREQRRQRVKV